jgi:aldehyde dehydrogenase (NAD+)
VFTKHLTRAIKFAKEMEAGMVCVNGAAPISSYTMPFGGWKQSGVGVELSQEGFGLWTQLNSVLVVE